jgi:uncharacterized membrane protein YkvA (DUF1232 family)
MAQSDTRPRRTSRTEPLLDPTDFTAYLREHADQLAPGDVRTLLSQAKTLRTRAAAEAGRHPRVPRQVELGLEIVSEHFKGRCPQIPYHTIAVLAVALLYFSDPLDVIPDWIPRIGKSDDALVLELAFALARPGVERYCQWKDIPTDTVLTAPKAPAPGRPRRGGKSR